MLDDLFSRAPQDSGLREDLAKAHYGRGTALVQVDRNADAIEEFRLAVALWRSLTPVANRAAEVLKGQLLAQNNLGVAMMNVGQFVAAEAAFQEEIDLAQPLAAQSPNDSDYQSAIGGGLSNRAVIAIRRRDLAGARTLFERAIPYHRLALKAAPSIMKYRQALSHGQENVSLARAQLGDRAGAVEAMREVITLAEGIAGDFPNVPRYRRDLAQSCCNLGGILKGSGQPHEAERAYRRALDEFQSLASRFPDVPGHQWDLATGHKNLAQLLSSERRFQQARDSFSEAISLFEDLMAKFPQWPSSREMLAEVSNSLAFLLATCSDSQVRQPARAVELAKRAVELDPRKGLYWGTLGVAYCRTLDWDSGLKALDKSSELNAGGAADTWFFLAMAYWHKGAKDQARQWYDKAVVGMEKDRPGNAELLRFRAEAAALLGVNEAPKSAGRKEENARQQP